MAKQIVKISQGRVKDRGTLWFPELVDKSKTQVTCMRVCRYFTIIVHFLGRSIKTHLYWAMKNCGRSGVRLRSIVDNFPTTMRYMYVYIMHVCSYMYMPEMSATSGDLRPSYAFYMYVYFRVITLAATAVHHAICPTTLPAKYRSQNRTSRKSRWTPSILLISTAMQTSFVE